MEYKEFKEKVEQKLTEVNPENKLRPSYKVDDKDEYLVEGVYETYCSILDCESGLNKAMKDILSIFAN